MNTNMITPKVSIIIPVYNAEQHLHQCLDSVLGQTFFDWECLLINDGSKDKSGEICDDYAARDCRFRAFHVPNGGVAKARQLGVSSAVGEYSIHVDSDDYIEVSMLSDMLGEAVRTKADIVVADYYKESFESRTEVSKQKPSDLTPYSMIKDILCGNIHGSLCNKLIRHKLYKQYNVSFFDGINYCEDVLVLAQMCSHQLQISYLPKAYYHYCERSESITHQVNKETYAMRKRFIDSLTTLYPDGQHNYLVRLAAHSLKISGVMDDLISKDEYYSYYPSKLDVIMSLSKVWQKALGLLLYIGLYSMPIKTFGVLQLVKLKLKRL